MRTTERRRTLLAGGLAALLLTALTACGGDEPAEETEPAAESATSSPSESASEPEAEPTEESDAPEASSGGLSEDELVDAMVAAMEDYGTAHIEMEIGGGTTGKVNAQGDVDYGGGAPSMQMKMQMPEMGSDDMEIRVVDGVMYMSIPPMTPVGKFMKLDPNDSNSPLAGMDGLTDQMDPRSSLDAFKKGLEKLEYVGEEDVDGEEMGHYILTVDTKAAIEANGGMAGSTKGVPKTITYDLWLDGDDLMRKMTFDMMDTKMTMTMSGWGEPIEVKAPPASAIVTQPGA